ncbi:uncharacterized protein FOMMEDRAFT_165457 [Fomitiporia mediterranea MF3/22]|uniref:uncharacterized protein n=1 Tax=Fomitiporia mediterranea (strain MF3/22) TaxID=694068 RepID=UPI0004409433|nr:uncharacterized protein FOMMEDRAFT_165457 [Fomitiporia mediterranea MF3/22]EJD06748.1 hypothetical protein FOMMEDRAFT_165457 [Fomitiporia mediterranea MF3/22]
MAHVVAHTRPVDLASILESPNPVVDLHIDEFERTSRRFLKAVAAYSARAIEEIAQRKSRHVSEMKRVAERTTQVEAEIQSCKVKEIELMQVLEKEQAEKRESESAVAELKRQFASVKEKCTSVDAEIDQYTDELNNLRKDKQKDMTVLDTHACRVSPELRDCVERLQFMLEGVGQDKLLIRFLNIDPNEPQREFSIVVDASNRVYQVPLTTPPIPTIPLLVDQLNKTRDVFAFIKSVRSHFIDMIKGPR